MNSHLRPRKRDVPVSLSLAHPHDRVLQIHLGNDTTKQILQSALDQNTTLFVTSTGKPICTADLMGTSTTKSSAIVAASFVSAVDRGRNDRGVPANPVAAAESHDKSVQFVLDDKNSAMQCETNPGGVLAHDSPFGGYFLTSWGLPENEKGGSGGAKRKKKKSV